MTSFLLLHSVSPCAILCTTGALSSGISAALWNLRVRYFLATLSSCLPERLPKRVFWKGTIELELAPRGSRMCFFLHFAAVTSRRGTWHKTQKKKNTSTSPGTLTLSSTKFLATFRYRKGETPQFQNPPVLAAAAAASCSFFPSRASAALRTCSATACTTGESSDRV